MALDIEVEFLGSTNIKQAAQGDTARIRFEFRNFAGALTNPDELLARVETADGAITEYEFAAVDSSSSSDESDDFVNPSSGILDLYLPLTKGGDYKFRAEGVVQGLTVAGQGKFYSIPEDPEEESSSSS